MKINFSLEGFNRSGGLRMIIALANRLAAEDHAVTITVPDYASDVPFPVADSVRIVVVGTPGPGFIARLYYSAYLCARSVRGCDVAFATGYKTAYYHIFSKSITRSRAKIIYMVQGYEPVSHVVYAGKRGLSKSLLFAAAKFSYRLPLTKVAVSHWLKGRIRGGNTRVIPNGVDRSVFFPREDIESRPFTIGTIGSEQPGKGYRHFLEAVSMLPSEALASVQVLVACEGGLAMPRNVQASQVSPGNDEEMASFYRSCDVFVFGSLMEGFGLPPLEAMACGAPVIVSDCGGIREYAGSDNAIVVPVGDAGAVCKAINRLMHDADARDRLRRAGLATAKRFGLQSTLDEYVQVIGRISGEAQVTVGK